MSTFGREADATWYEKRTAETRAKLRDKPRHDKRSNNGAAEHAAENADTGTDRAEIGSAEMVSPPGEPMPNARRFLDASYHHKDRCLLIQQGGQFYRWDGTCWPALEDPILKAQLYKWFEAKQYAAGDKMQPFAPTTRKVADLFDATKAITIIETTTPTPSWLGKEATVQAVPRTEHCTAHIGQLPADELISCENGLVHWPTRKLYPHQPAYYVHHSVPFAFDLKAPAPDRWLAFLKELFPNDDSSIRVLQEAFGYLVSGDTRQQKMFLLVGPKRGGKGTIGRVLTRMLGRHNVAGPTLASLGTNFGLQDIIGKPVALVSDARIGGKSDASLIAERLLSISGEDLQNVDRKYLPPWSGYLPTRFVVLTNELPRFTDASGALASRFVMLMLTKSFYDKENPTLTEELCAELPGIFNWALNGIQQLRARGRFIQPKASLQAIRELEDIASPVGAFIRDCCTLGPNKKVEVDTLYRHYRKWCEDNGHKVASASLFGRDLKASRPEIGSSRPWKPEGQLRPRYHDGIAIGADHADDEPDVATSSLSPLDCLDCGDVSHDERVALMMKHNGMTREQAEAEAAKWA